MKYDPNKSVKRLSNNIEHDIVQLRTPSARRRRKSKIDNNEKMTPTIVQSSENLWPHLQKCLICRNSECIDNKCCEFLQSSPSNLSHHKIQTIKKYDQSPTSPLFCPLKLSSQQLIHNQQQLQQQKNNNSQGLRSSQIHQCHQQQQQYCNSTSSRFDVQKSTTPTTISTNQQCNPITSTSSQSQIPKGSEKLLIREDTKMVDIRWLLPVAYGKNDFFLSKCSKKFKSWRTFTNKIPSLVVWLAISLLLVNFSINLIVSGAYAKDIKPRLRGAGKVCPSLDVRNNPSEFRNLSECSVIEGFLIISLMDKFSAQDYDMSFPDLTEITDYMIVYRVNGLKTLARLFPNLSVIRGNVLFEGYALVIYENTHLEEIGLRSLSTIKRGAVRIEKNPVLCFVETIDWSQIAVNTSSENHFFRSNKVLNECPSCPGGNSKSDRSDSGHHIDEGKSCTEYQGGRRYCWNRQHCQKICPTHCKNSCNDKRECCHTSCLGGCANNNVNSCSVCKHLVYGNECTDVCPENSYKYLERSCVTVQECFSKSPPLNAADLRSEYPFIPFQGVCSNRCPPGFEKYRNETCRRCDDKCVKMCPAASIDTISDARRLRGCTVVTGSLIISIRQGGPHIMEDLQVALSSIEEIEGYLKVTRSFSLLSLSFFKGLKVIRGKELDSNTYALYVLDNQNLQSIWGDNQTVLIEKGRIFFHFNPKLCYYKIENLRSMMVDNATLDKSEVAKDSNGDRGTCNITKLDVIIQGVGPRAVILRVQPMVFEDDRGFIGYQYYYIEAPFQNVSIFDSRHGCGNDGWNVDDDNSKQLDHIITHLKPYTQYAFYVRTYTISTVTNNGQSPIMYFRTQPDKPEPVRNLRSITNSSSEVIVKWSPPRVANGNLTIYVIKANLTLDDPKLLEQRNYCDEPIKESFEVPTIIKPDEKEIVLPDKNAKDCKCDDTTSRGSKKSPKIEEGDLENMIDFEDAIQNFVYVKRDDREKKSVRRKRDLDNMTVTTTDISAGASDKIFPKEKEQSVKNVSNQIDPIEITKSLKKGNYFIYIYKTTNTSIQELVLKNLKHYSTYTISVKACREGIGDRCSNEAITYSRTGRLGGADNVENLIAEVISSNSSRSDVRLKWDPPREPNGLIVSYSIRYSRADIEHAKGIDQCITQRGYENLTNGFFVLKNLETGNYSVQIMATSLAGDGNYSAVVHFYIPEKSISWQVILAICFTTFLLLLLIGVLIWYIRKKYVATVPDLKLFTSVNPEYVTMHYTQDEWEIAREMIIQLRELGQGSFGMVYEGIVKNLNKIEEDTPCAIKTVNESATDRERINFLNEASVMKEFDTHHVVRLLGVCSRGQPTLVVMELMKFGDLKAYLRSHRPDSEMVKGAEHPPQPPTLKRILQMAIEIADGMAYLSAKKFVHRDLAARNCMVACDLTVKIGDFGMTRDIYETDYYRKGTKGLLPVRWMAPESLKDGVFSSASDVFSYGVVLWEMATLASQPYQGLSNDQVLRYVIDGGVMERPENCPDKLYDLMRKCWQHRPTSRPSFIDIIQILLDDADSKFREVSFYHSQEGQDILAQMQPPADFDDVTTPLRVGDDDFKMEIEDNYLNNSKHSRKSHLAATEGQPHSPYSFGSAILTSSTPGVASSLKRSNPNSLLSSSSSLNKQQQFPEQLSSSSKYYPTDGATSSTIANAAIPVATPATPATIAEATPATGTVQNFLNSLSAGPRSRRMEFLRNAFLGSGNNSNSNNNSIQKSGGNGGGNLYGQTGKAGTGVISTIADSNEYNDGKNGNSRKSSKDYQILNESGVSTDDTGRDMKSRRPSTNYEQLSLPSLFSLDKRTQQPKQQQKQCNELDSKVTNSRRNSTKLSHSTSDSNSGNSCKDAEKMSTTASPYQLQQQQQQQQQHEYRKDSGTPNRTSLQQPNGYIIASPQTDYSFSQDYQEGVPEEQMLLTKFHK